MATGVLALIVAILVFALSVASSAFFILANSISSLFEYLFNALCRKRASESSRRRRQPRPCTQDDGMYGLIRTNRATTTTRAWRTYPNLENLSKLEQRGRRMPSLGQ